MNRRSREIAPRVTTRANEPLEVAISRLVPAAAVVIALLVSSCSASDGAPIVVVTDSAGVTIVRATTLVDSPMEVSSEPVRTLGGKDTDEESFFRVSSGAVGSDARGNIYVLDPDSYHVQVFDSAGRHLRTLGNEGEGPGELEFPFALSVADDGRVWVADIGKQAFVRWDGDGQVMEADPLPQDYRGGEVKWTSGGLIMPLRTSEGNSLVTASATGESTTLTSLAMAETRALDLKSCGMRFSGFQPIFSPSLVWAARGATVVIARNPAYAIDVYEGGLLVRSVRRSLELRPASAELAEASLGDGMRVETSNGERVCDPAEVVEQQGYAPFLPMIRRLALAPDGTLWVQRFEVGDSVQAVDLFDPSGQYLGTLPNETPFPVGFLPDGRMLASEKDAFDVEYLVIRSLDIRLSK